MVTVDNDIFFSASQFAPEMWDGMHLRAKELIQVLQQSLLRSSCPSRGADCPALQREVESLEGMEPTSNDVLLKVKEQLEFTKKRILNRSGPRKLTTAFKVNECPSIRSKLSAYG